MKSSQLIWHYVSVKSTVKIWSIFVAFSENTNFNRTSKVQPIHEWNHWCLCSKPKSEVVTLDDISDSFLADQFCQ